MQSVTGNSEERTNELTTTGGAASTLGSEGAFLHIGHATLSKHGEQRDLPGVAYRWQDHLSNRAREKGRDVDALRYRVALRKASELRSTWYLRLPGGGSTSDIASLASNTHDMRLVKTFTALRSKVARRRPRTRIDQTIMYAKRSLERSRTNPKSSREEAPVTDEAVKHLMPHLARSLKTVPWTTWAKTLW